MHKLEFPGLTYCLFSSDLSFDKQYMLNHGVKFFAAFFRNLKIVNRNLFDFTSSACVYLNSEPSAEHLRIKHKIRISCTIVLIEVGKTYTSA